ncbi:hypothetical protein B0H21DRAFT_827293 [Amylocystis lapponica]|nr:hypothetical protein B0H21DRAFT_827293 [Amylocystis lapponica]
MKPSLIHPTDYEVSQDSTLTLATSEPSPSSRDNKSENPSLAELPEAQHQKDGLYSGQVEKELADFVGRFYGILVREEGDSGVRIFAIGKNGTGAFSKSQAVRGIRFRAQESVRAATRLQWSAGKRRMCSEEARERGGA